MRRHKHRASVAKIATLATATLICINGLSGCTVAEVIAYPVVYPIAYVGAVATTAATEGISDAVNENRRQTAIEADEAGERIFQSEILKAQAEQSNSQGEEEAVAATPNLKASYGRGEMSGEEYMQRQRTIIYEHTGRGAPGVKRAISTSNKGHWRVALLPIVSLSGSSDSSRDAIFYDFIHQYVSEHQNLELVFSDYDPRFEYGLAGTESEVWTGGFTQKAPNRPQVVQGAKKVGADLAILISFKRRIPGSGSYDDFIFSIYVADIETGKMYTMQGDDTEYKKVIENSLKRFAKKEAPSTPH